MEAMLVEFLGEDALKEIGEQLAEIVRQHDLQKSPEVCRLLFTYMADVVDGWNPEDDNHESHEEILTQLRASITEYTENARAVLHHLPLVFFASIGVLDSLEKLIGHEE